MQVREKETDTGEVSSACLSWMKFWVAEMQFIEVARRTKEICDKVSRTRLISETVRPVADSSTTCLSSSTTGSMSTLLPVRTS